MKLLPKAIKKLELLVFLMIFLLLDTSLSYAAEISENKFPIYVSSQCDDDNVGSRMIYRIKEQLRSSSRMAVTDRYLDSTMQLVIICLAPAQEDQGIISQYAYSITALNTEGHYDYHVRFGVGTCGSNKVSQCAETTVARIDEAIGDLISKIRDGKFKYQK